MCNKGHKYQKFDEQYLFCGRCGEMKLAVYRGSRYYVWPQPWQPYTPYWRWSGTTSTVPFTNWSTFNDNATFTIDTNVMASTTGDTNVGEEDKADPGVRPE
jgi:hypothetical protein